MGGYAKLTIDRYMLTLKEEASTKEFCFIRNIFGRNNDFDEELDLDMLFKYLMEYEI
jgi:hypothetical protein